MKDRPLPARPEDIPRAVREGEMTILGVRLRVYHLDDGTTVIHADDFHRLLDEMGMIDDDDPA